ncbi:hypothetical protein LQE85_12025 [Stenotrophomonas rhizophila]|uniref:hypothetical protein n=1 Tax=Stenotrophomonas rhizophila TaxID=216778 RepID=UPI00201CCC9E|nr:hypothetical protein [Stenotrophomonas rhizophila]UQY89712.1 hypothetical protein LQE85_12025 [Stenotrophomonas rhizophila]
MEAPKKRVEKRDEEVPKALAVLKRYAKVLTPAQRRQVAKIIGGAIEAPSGRILVVEGPTEGAQARFGRTEIPPADW